MTDSDRIVVEDLNVSYGDIQVLWDVSLEIRETDDVVSLENSR